MYKINFPRHETARLDTFFDWFNSLYSRNRLIKTSSKSKTTAYWTAIDYTPMSGQNGCGEKGSVDIGMIRFRKSIRKEFRDLEKFDPVDFRETLRDSTISRHLNYAYLPISKSANTFLKRLLWQVEHENGFARPLNENYFSIHNIGWKYAEGEASPWVPITKDMKKEFKLEWGKRDFRFSVVRNPFARLLSAYLDKIGGKKEKSKHLLFRHLNSVPKFDPLSLSFEAFVDVVAGTRDSYLNKHWVPQLSCLAPQYLSYSYIGQFEDMDKVLDRLRAHFPNNTTSINNINDAIHKTDSNTRIEEYYHNPNIIKKVYQRYRYDFELLGYDKNPLNTKPVKAISKDLLR